MIVSSKVTQRCTFYLNLFWYNEEPPEGLKTEQAIRRRYHDLGEK